jgi:hypothetical protein
VISRLFRSVQGALSVVAGWDPVPNNVLREIERMEEKRGKISPINACV